MNLLNNPELRAKMEKFKKNSEELRPRIRRQILDEHVNLDTYITWLKDSGNRIDASAAAAELKMLQDPEYLEAALVNLRHIWLNQDQNRDWLEKEIERRVKLKMSKPINNQD